MSTNTTNLGLTKLTTGENFSNSILNANWQAIDDFAGGFGQFTYVYKGGLGHITGESRLDKFVRAYNANAFPIGKPFFGYISAGSQLLVMGYLYNSDNKLYGSGWISSYDGCTEIRVQADNWYSYDTSNKQYDYSQMGSTQNGATVQTAASYTRASKKNGWVFLKLRITIPTISATTKVFSLVEELRPFADISYVMCFNQWNPSIADVITINGNGDVLAQASGSGKDLTILISYPAAN